MFASKKFYHIDVYKGPEDREHRLVCLTEPDQSYL